MKTFRILLLLFGFQLVVVPQVHAQKKNPTSVEEAEKILSKKNKKKQKENAKYRKQSKKNFGDMQTKEFRKSLKRNKKRQKRKARGLD